VTSLKGLFPHRIPKTHKGRSTDGKKKKIIKACRVKKGEHEGREGEKQKKEKSAAERADGGNFPHVSRTVPGSEKGDSRPRKRSKGGGPDWKGNCTFQKGIEGKETKEAKVNSRKRWPPLSGKARARGMKKTPS